MISYLKSPAMTDLLRLTLFYGNLVNSTANPSYKEITAFQLESILRLVKYKSKSGIFFFDMILQLIPQHAQYIEQIKANNLC